jgi:NAD(P)-dependent dehydrogenase (short-subunit alcohol dehydrogenase family)
MESKSILITGATDGIGRETAKELASAGHRVIIHGRNNQKLQDTGEFIRKKTGKNVFDTYAADLGKLIEVQKMAGKILHEHPLIDVLINNAGVYQGQLELTEDGLEKTFAINHLSHFLLTNKLLPLIRKSKQGRIVVVSSKIHASSIDFSNLQGEKFFNGSEAYSRSKLANILFSQSLHRSLKHTNVTVNALHPGVINTKLLKKGFGPFGHSVAQGAKTSVYLATHPELSHVSGKYFSDQREATPASITKDRAVQDRLWKISEQLIEQFIDNQE